MEYNPPYRTKRKILLWPFLVAGSLLLSACDDKLATKISNIIIPSDTINSANTGNNSNNNVSTAIDTQPTTDINTTKTSNPIAASITSTNSGPGNSSKMTLSISWLSNPEPVDGYVVYNGPSPNEAVNELTVTPQTSVQYDIASDLGLHIGDRTCFRLQAYNAGGKSGFSKAVCLDITEPLAAANL